MSDNPITPQGWQPIETAPKDRKVLVGYHNALGNWRTVAACYHTQLPWHDEHDWHDWHDWPEDEGEYAPAGWYEASETHDCILPLGTEPTHWMPLPPAPGEAA